MVENTGDMMRGKRGSFATSGERKFGEQGVGGATGNFGKGVAVEKEKRRATMATP